MHIHIIPVLKDNYSYVIEAGKDCVCVIDPGEASKVIDFLEEKNLKLTHILNTHHHNDHIDGNLELKKKYRAQIICSKYDFNRIKDADIFVTDAQTLELGSLKVKVIDIIGHTLGHIAFYIQELKSVFVGDTLFSVGCGRVFEGTYENMVASLDRLKNLPNDIKIYPGHEYTLANIAFALSVDNTNQELHEAKKSAEKLRSLNLPTIPTTIAKELAINPFLRLANNDIIRNIGLNINSSNLEIFTMLRNLKNNFV